MSLAEYVIQDAREKCFEIEVKALKSFEQEKKVLVEKEQININEDYAKKLKEKDMERKM